MRLLVLLVAVVLLVVLVRTMLGGGRRVEIDRTARRPDAGEDLVQDPACHAYVPRSRAVAGVAGGEALFFCSDACAERFRRSMGA